MGPGDLEQVISRMPVQEAPELLTNVRSGEDAGVYLIDDDLAVIQTVDFFPPIVDDPFVFGQIAAANALSDIYAMGARPITAMNLVAFPCSLGLDVLEQILLGGYQKVAEAGAVMVGGHTVEDNEPKYGLAVLGLGNPSRLTTIGGAKSGDVLVLNKPIGTGILATALMADFIEEKDMLSPIESMKKLNKGAADVLAGYEVSACTDVTGFGLIGHLYEMVKASGTAAELWAREVPLFENTMKMGAMGMLPAGLYRNKDFVGSSAIRADETKSDLGQEYSDLVDYLFDPQTSGGLLAAVDPGQVERLLVELRSGPCPDAAAVGRITEGPKGKLFIRERSS